MKEALIRSTQTTQHSTYYLTKLLQSCSESDDSVNSVDPGEACNVTAACALSQIHADERSHASEVSKQGAVDRLLGCANDRSVSDTWIGEKSLFLQCGDLLFDHFTVWSFGADRVAQTKCRVEGDVEVRDVSCWGRTVPDAIIPSVAVLDERIFISRLESSFDIVERNLKPAWQDSE